MQRGWSILFGVVLAAILIFTVVSPFFGWWMPADISLVGDRADLLFYVILGFVTFFYVLTEVILVYAMYRYPHREGHKSDYTHGSHRLEVAWTVVPAAILLFIAFAQISTWMEMKYQSRFPPPDITVQITARQWEWRMRYPAQPGRFSYDKEDAQEKVKEERLAWLWAEKPEVDDVHLANEIHTWKGATVKAYLKTLDVLHSFTLPNLRFKQDALPGKTIPVWFSATEANTEFDPGTGKCKEPADSARAWEIACQEHCGARHYAMRGRLYVHESKEDYEAWLNCTRQRQNETNPEPEKPAPAVAAARR